MAVYFYKEVIGFISLAEINNQVSEIYVMGIKREFHRQGIGGELLNLVEAILKKSGKKYLSVKTLSEFHPDEYYAKTRKFYLKNGFVPIYELDIWGPENPCILMIKQIK